MNTTALIRGSNAISSTIPRATVLYKPSITDTKSAQPTLVHLSIRYASSSSSSSPLSTSSSSAASAPAAKLDWNSFFELRKSRRRLQMILGVVGFGSGTLGGASVMTTGLLQPVLSQVPIDPIATMGISTAACGALGWLLGPSVGSGIFYWWNRRVRSQFTQKENDFFARIKKNRVDPSSSSASNPVPDYYGEKISSVKGYRQWLKDQRAFNKKRTHFV